MGHSRSLVVPWWSSPPAADPLTRTSTRMARGGSVIPINPPARVGRGGMKWGEVGGEESEVIVVEVPGGAQAAEIPDVAHLDGFVATGVVAAQAVIVQGDGSCVGRYLVGCRGAW